MSFLRLIILLAALGTHVASAHARPIRVVILEIDGHRARSAAARTVVVDLLSGRSDLLSTRSWTHAFTRTGAWGKQRWHATSRATGAEAVIEGFLVDDGVRHSLTVVVRRASTGEHVDDVTVNLEPNGMTETARRQLDRELGGILDWMIEHPS